MSEGLDLWTVYAHPLDYPEGFMVVRWTAGAGVAKRGEAHKALTLEAARALVPPGLYRMPGQPSDDPAILETWI